MITSGSASPPIDSCPVSVPSASLSRNGVTSTMRNKMTVAYRRIGRSSDFARLLRGDHLEAVHLRMGRARREETQGHHQQRSDQSKWRHEVEVAPPSETVDRVP